MANSDLQNSYGPEMAPSGHDLPQTVASDGLEALPPGQQHVLAPPYNEQYAKNNQYNPVGAEAPHDTGRKRRVAGLPIAAFWGIIIGLVLILAIGLGVGLGVGLSQRNSSEGSSATPEATTSAGADSTTTSAASLTPSGTTASTSSTTVTSTASATSAAATARNVQICNQASLVPVSDCTNLTVPVNTCSMSSYTSAQLRLAPCQRILMLTLCSLVNFPSDYNDSVSSVNTGGPECYFYTYAHPLDPCYDRSFMQSPGPTANMIR